MKKSILFLFLICLGCVKKPVNSALSIKVINSNTVSFGGIDYNSLVNLQQDSLSNASWQTLLPVYKMPADTGMIEFQKPQPGKYSFKNNQLTFSADTPFQKNSRYFARFYRLHDDGDVWKILKGKWKQGAPAYTACTFTL